MCQTHQSLCTTHPSASPDPVCLPVAPWMPHLCFRILIMVRTSVPSIAPYFHVQEDQPDHLQWHLPLPVTPSSPLGSRVVWWWQPPSLREPTYLYTACSSQLCLTGRASHSPRRELEEEQARGCPTVPVISFSIPLCLSLTHTVISFSIPLSLSHLPGPSINFTN
jgi:hypothetical protein